MNQDYTFVYEPIQDNQIRLVKFTHESHHTSANLETFFLEGPIPPYHALSYSWVCDDPCVAKTSHLHIENQRLPVLDALQPFIHVLKSKNALFNDTWWWIDSICIDLANTEERGKQVQLMRRIYRNAHKVIFWLGRESHDTEGAISFIELLNNTVRQRIYNPDEIRGMFQQAHYDKDWASLTNFFQRRWWSRIWTLQEYAIPASVSFWYGIRSVSRDAVDGALMAGDQCTGLAFKATAAFFHGFARRRVQRLHDLRQTTGTKPSMSLVALAAYSSCFEATDDRDRLYGIRALATDAFLLDVDYSLTVEEIYLRFVKSFIEHHKSLDIICFASIHTASPGSSLPSWVPDWRTTVTPRVVPVLVSQSARTHIGNLRSPADVDEPGDPLPYFAASRNSAAVYSFEGSKLLARGIVLDTIDGLVGSTNTELIQSSPEASSESTYSPSNILRCVCRCLVHDRKDRFLRFAMPAEEFYRGFMWLCAHLITEQTSSISKEFQEWFDRAKSLRIHGHSFEGILRDSEESRIDPLSLVPNQDEYILDTFFGRFYDTVVRMLLRLTVTINGRIGLVPEKARKGDLVCVLFGCSVPVLLRQSGHEDTWTFVGECFLDGFMEGQALDGNFTEKMFCVE